LRKRGRSVVHNDTPDVRAMAASARHLVHVEEVVGEHDG
jgi:ribosomal protein L30/L7E